MTAPFLRLTSVTKTYRDRQVVDGITLDVGSAESVVILGPSGCGKTTLLRLIAGLARLDSGEIWIAGRLVSGADAFVPPYERNLGFVFQDLALWPHLTVRKNLDFVLKALRIPNGERRARADAILELVQIDQLSNRFPHELSGGEQQRVALARALVGEPRLVLLDEPLSSLDADLRTTLRDELRRLQRALGLTTIYVTHDRDDAAVLADRRVDMRDGRIIAVHQSTPQEQRS